MKTNSSPLRSCASTFCCKCLGKQLKKTFPSDVFCFGGLFVSSFMHETLATWAIAQFFAASSVKPTQGTRALEANATAKRKKFPRDNFASSGVKFASSCLHQALTDEPCVWHRKSFSRPTNLNSKRIVVRTRDNIYLNGTLWREFIGQN